MSILEYKFGDSSSSEKTLDGLTIKESFESFINPSFILKEV